MLIFIYLLLSFSICIESDCNEFGWWFYHCTVKWSCMKKRILLSVQQSHERVCWQDYKNRLYIWQKRWFSFLLNQHDWWWDKWKDMWEIEINDQLILSVCAQNCKLSHWMIWSEDLKSVWLWSQSCILHFLKLIFESQKVSDSSCSTLIYQLKNCVSQKLTSSLFWCQVCLNKLVSDLSRRT